MSPGAACTQPDLQGGHLDHQDIGSWGKNNYLFALSLIKQKVHWIDEETQVLVPGL